MLSSDSRNIFCTCVTLLLLTVSFPSVAQSQPTAEQQSSPRFALSVKPGFTEFVDTTQMLRGGTRSFDDHPTNDMAIEFEWRIARTQTNNLWVGAEMLTYSNKSHLVSNPASTNTLDAWGVLLKTRYLLGSSTDTWQPYVGGGLGVLWVSDWSGGPIDGVKEAPSLQATLGMQFRWQDVALKLEYNYTYASTDDKDGNSINLSTRGPYIGLVFFFGSGK